MSKYPSGMHAIVGAKQQRMNKIYGTCTTKPAGQYQTKGNTNMFKRMIKGLVTWSLREDHSNDITIAEGRDEPRIGATGIKFEVYRANGGTVVETRRYNRKNDDNIYELHVITDTQDVGQAIGQIITMEALKS